MWGPVQRLQNAAIKSQESLVFNLQGNCQGAYSCSTSCYIRHTSSSTMRLHWRQPRALIRSAKPSRSASAILRLSPPLSCLAAQHSQHSASACEDKLEQNNCHTKQESVPWPALAPDRSERSHILNVTLCGDASAVMSRTAVHKPFSWTVATKANKRKDSTAPKILRTFCLPEASLPQHSGSTVWILHAHIHGLADALLRGAAS
jgi:hypothetical protein